MDNLPTTITDSTIWKTTLARRNDDSCETERERLRSTFITFRERCKFLAD
jgi:hypothetical protein